LFNECENVNEADKRFWSAPPSSEKTRMRHIGGALDFLNSQGPDSSFLNCRKTDPRYGIDDPKRAGILVEQLAAEGGAALKTDQRYGTDDPKRRRYLS